MHVCYDFLNAKTYVLWYKFHLRLGRKRKYALGKTSGKANIKKNIENLGLNLSDDEIKAAIQIAAEISRFSTLLYGNDFGMDNLKKVLGAE